MPKIEMGEDVYRIVGDGGEEGLAAVYGDSAVLDVPGHHYIALVDVEGEETVSLLPDDVWVIDGRPVAGVEVEDVDFDLEGGEGGEGGGGGEEEGGKGEGEGDEGDQEEGPEDSVGDGEEGDEDEDEEDDDLIGDDPDEDEDEGEEEEEEELELAGYTGI